MITCLAARFCFDCRDGEFHAVWIEILDVQRLSFGVVDFKCYDWPAIGGEADGSDLCIEPIVG